MEKVKKILCVLFGHPPVVESCWGHCHCGRCGELLGDTLGGAYSTHDKALVGHECQQCDKVWNALRWRDKLLTDR